MSIKKIFFDVSARYRSRLVLQAVKVIYNQALFGWKISQAIERLFDPNNIRRKSSITIKKTVIHLKTSNGCVLELHLDDHVDWKTFLQGDFDSICFNLMTKLTETSGYTWTFIDIGANIGAICVPIGIQYKVLAFEPQEDLANRLIRNFEINECKDCRVVNSALT